MERPVADLLRPVPSSSGCPSQRTATLAETYRQSRSSADLSGPWQHVANHYDARRQQRSHGLRPWTAKATCNTDPQRGCRCRPRQRRNRPDLLGGPIHTRSEWRRDLAARSFVNRSRVERCRAVTRGYSCWSAATVGRFLGCQCTPEPHPGALVGDAGPQGSRNGHCPTTIKTTSGPITLERPKLRGTEKAFASRLLGTGVCRTSALESLVIASFVRGLSVRDVEATLAEALGSEAALSKSTVSRILRPSRSSSRPGARGTCRGSPSTTCSSMGRHFKFHPGAPASRCSSPGASPPRAHRCSSAWPRASPRATTPGPGSSPTSPVEAWPCRSWSSPTVPRD